MLSSLILLTDEISAMARFSSSLSRGITSPVQYLYGSNRFCKWHSKSAWEWSGLFTFFWSQDHRKFWCFFTCSDVASFIQAKFYSTKLSSLVIFRIKTVFVLFEKKGFTEKHCSWCLKSENYLRNVELEPKTKKSLGFQSELAARSHSNRCGRNILLPFLT